MKLPKKISPKKKRHHSTEKEVYWTLLCLINCNDAIQTAGPCSKIGIYDYILCCTLTVSLNAQVRVCGTAFFVSFLSFFLEPQFHAGFDVSTSLSLCLIVIYILWLLIFSSTSNINARFLHLPYLYFCRKWPPFHLF